MAHGLVDSVWFVGELHSTALRSKVAGKLTGEKKPRPGRGSSSTV